MVLLFALGAQAQSHRDITIVVDPSVRLSSHSDSSGFVLRANTIDETDQGIFLYDISFFYDGMRLELQPSLFGEDAYSQTLAAHRPTALYQSYPFVRVNSYLEIGDILELRCKKIDELTAKGLRCRVNLTDLLRLMMLEAGFDRDRFVILTEKLPKQDGLNRLHYFIRGN